MIYAAPSPLPQLRVWNLHVHLSCVCVLLCSASFSSPSLHRIFAFDAPDIYLEYMNKNLIGKNTQNKKLWNFFSLLLVLISWKCETLRQGEWELGDMIDVVESHFGNEKRARTANNVLSYNVQRSSTEATGRYRLHLLTSPVTSYRTHHSKRGDKLVRNWALKLSYLYISTLPPPPSTPWLNVDKSQHDMTSARSFKRWTVAFHTHSLYESSWVWVVSIFDHNSAVADSFWMVVEFIIELLQRD